MNKKAKIKKFGKRKVQDITLKLPDSVTILENYDIDIIEFDTIGHMKATIYVSKNGIDIDSQSVNLNIKDSYKLGIKKLIDRLSVLTEIPSAAAT